MARTTPVPEIVYISSDDSDEAAIDLAFDYLFDLLLANDGGSLPQV